MKIDLATEQGNALELIAICMAAAKQMEMPPNQVVKLVQRLTENLLSVMDQAFPFCFEFVHNPRSSDG